MPKMKSDWESEYRDPASDAEDVRQAEAAEKLTAAIMHEIQLCRQMEDDQDFEDSVSKDHEEQFIDDLLEDSDYEHYGS